MVFKYVDLVPGLVKTTDDPVERRTEFLYDFLNGE